MEKIDLKQRTRSLVPYLLIAGVWVVFLAGTFYVTVNSFDSGAAIDFYAYYIGASTLHQGKSLYSGEVHEAVAASVGVRNADLLVYPPMWSVLMQPFVWVSPNTGAVIWFGVNVVLLLALMGLLFRAFGPQDLRLRLLLSLFPALSVPVFATLYLGQLNFVMLLLVFLAYLAFVHDRPYASGALLAFAAWIKIWPLVLIAYFGWKREWKVLAGAAVAAMLVALATFVTVGPTPMANFFTEMAPTLFGAPQAGLEHLNQSIPGFFNKLFYAANPFFYPLADNPMLARWGGLVGMVLLVVVTVALCSLPARLRSQEQFDTEFMLVLIAALLVAQRLWESGLVLLFPVYFLLVARMEREKNITWVQVLPAIVSMTFVDVDRIVRTVAEAFSGEGAVLPGVLLISPFLGAMLMWLVLTARRVREIRSAEKVQTAALDSSGA